VVHAAMLHLASGYMLKIIAVQFDSFGERFFYNSPMLVVEYLLVRAAVRFGILVSLRRQIIGAS
jgi:hypothetical protein